MARRRGRNEGAVIWHRKDRDGRDVWKLRWYLGRDALGRKQYGSTLFHGTEAEARKELRGILARLDRGEPVATGPETLGQYLDRWLRDYKGSLSPTTKAGYINVIENHLKPALGSIHLHRVTPQQLQAYYGAKLKEELSPTTVRMHARILHAAFRQAMKEGKLGVNPVDLTEPPKPEDYQAAVWTREQALRFLEVAEPANDPGQVATTDRFYALWVLLLSTGLRIGEALALKWDDLFLDAEPPYLRVRTSHYDITKKEADKIGAERRGTKAPKSKKGLRPIVLDRRTVEALRRHRERQEIEKRAMGEKYQDQGRVFANAHGHALYRSNVYEHFTTLTKTAGLPRIRLHDLRHTHDTHLKQAGVHPRDQQDRLGHATLVMTERYTHVLTPDQIEAARKWEAFMYGDKPEKPAKRQGRRKAEKPGGAS